jgi:hypothetical protein
MAPWGNRATTALREKVCLLERRSALSAGQAVI